MYFWAHPREGEPNTFPVCEPPLFLFQAPFFGVPPRAGALTLTQRACRSLYLFARQATAAGPAVAGQKPGGLKFQCIITPDLPTLSARALTAHMSSRTPQLCCLLIIIAQYPVETTSPHVREGSIVSVSSNDEAPLLVSALPAESGAEPRTGGRRVRQDPPVLHPMRLRHSHRRRLCR